MPLNAQAQEQKLLGIFDQQNADGRNTYSDDEVRHVLPLLILSSKIEPSKLTGPVKQVLGEFASRAQLDLNASPEVIQNAIRAYYAKHPANPSLMAAIGKFLRDPEAPVQAAAWASRTSKSGGGWSK